VRTLTRIRYLLTCQVSRSERLEPDNERGREDLGGIVDRG